MRSIVIVTFSLALGFTSPALAEDIVRSNAGKQHTAQPSTRVSRAEARAAVGVRDATVHAGKNRFPLQPNVGLQQNHAAFGLPSRRGSLAMSGQRTRPANRPAEMLDEQGPGHKIGGTNRRGHTGNGHANAAAGNRRSFFDALKRCQHQRHDRNWWNRHCRTIVLVNTGYYYLDTGYWYPAYGYSQTYDSYDYDGPIYTYANLLPDQVIANVQAALRDAGYYLGAITGSLNPATRAAISNFQRDYGLIITGAIDEPTVQTLGLN